MTDPSQRGADGSEANDWWNDRKRRRDPGGAEEVAEEKKARAGDGSPASAGGGTGGGPSVSQPSRKRPPPLSMEVENVSPIPSPVPRASRASEKALSLPRTRSTAPPGRTPQAGAEDGAPEPPKRRNRSVPRSGDRDISVSPDPDSMGSYLPTTPDEMGVVKGRLFGIHLSTDSVRAKRSRENVGIEEVIYAVSPSRSPGRSPARSPARSLARSPSPGRSPRLSPIGGGEVLTAKPESNGVLDLRQVEAYANKYEAKLLELERRQRELEERSRQRQRELEEERQREAGRVSKEREREEQRLSRERERERQLHMEREEQRARERDRDSRPLRKDADLAIQKKQATDKQGGAAAGVGGAVASGQDRLFPRSEDGSMAGDSSEFLLVLLPNSRATTEERGG